MGISANNEDWILRNLKYDAKWKCFTCAERSECWAFLSCCVRESRQRQHTWSHWSIATLNITLIVTLGTWTRIWAIKLWPLSCLITKQKPFNTILFSFCSYSPVRTGRGLTRLFVSTPPPTPEAVSASHIVKMRQILNPDKGIYLLPISDITVRER